MLEDVRLGDRVYVPDQKRPFKVRCRDERYIICTKPFNIRKTVQYFIVDLEEKVRGPDDRVFCMGYETDDECAERLAELEAGDIIVSFRNRVPLDCYVKKGRKHA